MVILRRFARPLEFDFTSVTASNQFMTISKKLWLGFGTMLVLLGLCGLTLLVRWPTSAVFDSSPESALRDLRLSFEIALVLVVAAGGIAAATGVVLRRKLVGSDVPLEKAFEEQFQQSVESAGFGAYSFDHETQTLVWSKQLRKIHGLPLDAVLTRERILQLIHPHDREHFRQRLVGMFSLPEGATYECEYRIFRPDGEERWLRDRGTFTFAGSNQSRRPIRAFGMILDVTDQKQNEELQHESEARHRAAFEGASVGMYQADSTTGHLLRVNRSFCQMLGFSSADP
ncbi:MAG: multi-sensor signal transduction histidine kinase [Planctomycetota bacterium]|nr:MAG: multi-sensor signal transduction histidine kinase [Planctomycetota bacterium]